MKNFPFVNCIIIRYPYFYRKGSFFMKLCRLISAALCAAVMVSASPLASVTAEESSSKTENAETEAMRKAIVDVKKRLDIPKELDRFYYETKTKYETTYYLFEWYRQEPIYKNGAISGVTNPEKIVVEYFNGFISSYTYGNDDEDYEYRYEYDDWDMDNHGYRKPGFSKLSVSEQDALAKNYLHQLNPGLKGNIILERSSPNMDLFDTKVRYRISRKESGIDFNGNYGSITIDRDTGKLLNYSLTWWNDAVLPDASKKLSVKEVSDIYASRKPLTAYYDLFSKREYNEETKSYTYIPYVLAVYKPKIGGENEIDALTGKYTSYYDDREKYSYTDAYTWENDYDYYEDEEAPAEADASAGAEGDSDDDYLSDAEKSALENEDKYLSYEEALKIIKADEYIVFNKELVLKYNSLSHYTDDKGETQVKRTLSFEFSSQDETKDSIDLRVSLDAYTGKILSFDKEYYYGSKSPNRNITPVKQKPSLEIAAKAAKHFIGDKASEYRYDGNWYDESRSSYINYTLGYTRYVNGLPAIFDDMNITVDSRGEVLSFGHTYHEIEFPAANLMPEEKAYEKLFEHMKPDLYYHGFTDLQLRSHVYLTYKFDSFYYLNAITGERITNYGDAYYVNYEEKPKKDAVLYTDIKGHKYEKEITELWNYGVRITDSETLKPDEAITIDEFLTLCGDAQGSYYNERIYPKVEKYDQKTGKKYYDKNPMLDKKLTLGELAKIYVFIYEHDCYAAAEIKGIFAPPYKNVSKDNKYCGYIAIAKAKGIIKDGKEFGYNKGLTRGRCLKAFYDYLASDEEKTIYQIVTI